MLVPVPAITDFEAFNAEILRLCDADHDRAHYKKGENLRELWEEERQKLLTLPEHEYDVFRYESLSVNKYGFITISKVKYGLPPDMWGKIVQAKIYFDEVKVFYDRSLIKTFRRSYKENEEVYDWRDYLGALTRKPGAVPHTRFFGQMPKLWQEYLKSANSRERKSALTLLAEIVKDGNEGLCDDALQLAGENGRTDADSIRQCYCLIAKTENYPPPLELTSNPPPLNYQPDLAVYDALYAQETPAEEDGDGQ
jgi:hypothetical protein